MILAHAKKKRSEGTIARDLDSTTAKHLTNSVLQGFTWKFFLFFFFQFYEGRIVGRKLDNKHEYIK